MKNKPIAIVFAMVANVVIAVAKFGAALFTGSAAMLSEGIHTLVDTGNDGLLLYGLHRSRRPPDEGHPFGHGKELYFWTLVVAMVIVTGGGIVSIYQGIFRLMAPRPLEHLEWNYVILGVSAICESFSLSVAYREFRRATRDNDELWPAIRASKDPSILAILFEDIAALVGLGVAFIGLLLAQMLNRPWLDAAASICIGVILIAAAWMLAFETRSLITGEGVRPATLRQICRLVQSDPAVEHIRRPLTMYLGPETVLLALDVQFEPSLSATQVMRAIDRVEKTVRSRYPKIRHIYIEAQSITAASSREDAVSPRRWVTEVTELKL
jgi:cation diffusion facilitator family transporter